MNSIDVGLLNMFKGRTHAPSQPVHAAGDTRYGAHIENAKHARAMQGTYYAEIRSILKGFTK